MKGGLKLISLITLISLIGQLAFSKEKVAVVTVDIGLERKLDTLYILKSTSLSFSGFVNRDVFFTTPGDDGRYHFEISLENPLDESFSIVRKAESDTTENLFSLLKGAAQEYFPLTSSLYMSEGDSVDVKIEKARSDEPLVGLWCLDYRVTFRGKGGAKLTAKQKIDSLLVKSYDRTPPFDSSLNYHHRRENVKAQALSILKDLRKEIPSDIFDMLKSDILYYGSWDMFPAMKSFFDNYGKENSPGKFIAAYQNAMSRYFLWDEPSDSRHHSGTFIRFLLEKAWFEAYIGGEYGQEIRCFDLLLENLEGEARDRTLVAFFTDRRLTTPEKFYSKAVSVMESEDCLAVMTLVKAKTPGFAAFNFDLEEIDGNRRKLSDFKGRWVFVDLWFTGCGACVTFFKKGLKPTEEYFEGDPRISFVSISVDRGKAKWKESVKKGIYTSPQAVNLYTNGEGWEHELIRYYGIQSFPSVLLIDPEGKLASFNSPELQIRDSEKLMNAILGYLDSNPD